MATLDQDDLDAITLIVQNEIALVIQDTEDIQSRLPATLTGGFMQAYVAGVSNSSADTISSRIATNIIAGSYDWPAAIGEFSDAVWDEPYSQHTTSGTFGKLMDTIRKSNLSIDGEVTSAITPTTLTFSSNVSAASSAYAHAVLLFVSGPLEGENSPIISTTVRTVCSCSKKN